LAALIEDELALQPWPMLSGGKSEKPATDSKHRLKKGLGHKLRHTRRTTEACDDKAWLAAIAPPPPADVATFLGSFSYAAADSQTWEDLPQDEVPEGLARSGPWLGLGIAEHQEVGGHTWYQVECSLALAGSKTVEWQVGRRLQHLRELWYERVKSELGKSYKQHFEDVHFAHRGGRRGTSVRLHTWCCRLAARINAGQLSPAIVALTLRFLEAPDMLRHEELQNVSGSVVAGSGAFTPKVLHVSSKRPPMDMGKYGATAAGEDSVSSRSTRCSLSDRDHLPAASSEGSDGSECEGDEDEEYESDFETESESGDEEDD